MVAGAFAIVAVVASAIVMVLWSAVAMAVVLSQVSAAVEFSWVTVVRMVAPL